MSHSYLKLEENHYSANLAKKELNYLLDKSGIPSKNIRMNNKITINRGGKIVRNASYVELLEEIRKKGFIEDLQKDIDRKDSIWGGTFGMSSNSKIMELKIEYAGYEEIVKCPARTIPIELELTEDILEFRKLACEHSSENDFANIGRYYRTYIFSCAALIEAFINRHILLINYNEKQKSPFADEEENRKMPVEDKLKKLFYVTKRKNENESVLTESIEWCHFKEIKDSRNKFIHSFKPYYGFEIKKLEHELNLVRKGVGGLLTLITQNQGKEPVSFIKRLATAPVVKYNPKP